MTDDASPEIDKLIEDLKSDEWDVSRNAVKVLIGDVRAVEPLIKTVRDGTLSADEVGEVLGEIGEPAMESLIKALKDKNEDVREAVAIALGDIGDVRAVEPLIEAAMDSRGSDRSLGASYHVGWMISAANGEIANAFGKIGDVRAVETLIEMTGSNGDFWDWAAEALRKIGDARAIEPLIELIRDKDRYDFDGGASQRSQYMFALGLIGDERAVEPLITALEDEDGDVCSSAAEALGQIGDERAIEPLIKALRDKGSYVRQHAAEALGKIGDERAVEPLIGALSNDNWRVRQAAAGALDKLGWVPEADGQRAAYLIAGKDWTSLVEWGGPAVEPLIVLLGDEASSIRWFAAEALGEIGDERAVEPLIANLCLPMEIWKWNNNKSFRKSAGKALVKITHIKGKEKENLIRFLESDDPAMVLIGASLLKGILEE